MVLLSTTVDHVVARRDEALVCRVTDSAPLEYDDEMHPEVEARPPHVRAASSMVHLVDRFAVVQDDANFLALVDPETHHVRSYPLPEGPEGLRVFDYQEGMGHHKLDLEACARVPDDDRPRLVAFGSGSSPSREWVVFVEWAPGRDEPETRLLEAPAFFDVLRDTTAFSGAGLNVEGAIFVGENTLRLYQRGNADPTGELDPVDATGDVSWPDLLSHLEAPGDVPPPPVENIIRYELGSLYGVRLTFSDAEPHGDRVLYSASAERGDTGDTVGSVLGLIDESGARWAELLHRDGTPFEGKVEGISFTPGDPERIFFVIDADASDEPSFIYEARLEGPWF